MTADPQAGPVRCAAVWSTATVGLAALTTWVLPDLARAQRALASGGFADQPFDRLLLWLGAAVALGCGGWLWTAMSVVALGAARGRAPLWSPGVPAGLRRLILAACGVALAGSVAAPAPATPGQLHRDRTGSAAASLSGLPLPDRATSATRPHDGRSVVVAPGDTLWELAERELPARADATRVAVLWQRIHHLNRDVIGPDPDVIQPDQRLRLPRR